MNLSALALRHRALTGFAMLTLAGAGIWAYVGLGRAEDPPFTIKNMVVVVEWPGASADLMAREVTDRIERKLQELPFLDHIDTQTKPGSSVSIITLRDSTAPKRVPELWYQVRKKLGDLQPTLPPGVRGPFFNDEFGDVFSLVYAMTGEGFTLPEMKRVAEDVRERLLTVPGVAKVQLVGQQDERIYLEFSPRRLAQFGLTLADVQAAVARENSVVAGGFVETERDRIYVRTGGGVDSAAALRALPVAAGGRVVPLGDIADVRRGTVEPPVSAMRFGDIAGGRPALGLAISMAEGGNMLELGRRVAARLQEVAPTLPMGIALHQANNQADVVAKDVHEFEKSFLEALAIVLVVSFLSLGWRTGIVVAISVPLVLAGVLVGMKLLGIDLQRISLGAMVIALGLLVDDAIIAVETMAVKLEQGWDRLRAGGFAFTSTAFPMLTGTLVTAAGFLPVGLAQSGTGEYTQDIFRVVGLSLILSWFVAVLFVPLLGATLLPEKAAHGPEHEVYGTRVYRMVRATVGWCVRRRWMVIGLTVLAFTASIAGFTRVPQQFFPASDRLEVIIDLRLPEGGAYAETLRTVHQVEAVLAEDAGVRNWVAYSGSGSPRFFLASAPELENANFGQIIANMRDVPAREALLAKLHRLSDEGGMPDVRMRSGRLELGPPVGYPVQFRIMGPDPTELRRVADEVRLVMRANPHLRNVGDSWGNAAKSVQVNVDADKARVLGLSTEDVSAALQTVLQGVTLTQYREGTELIPVVARARAEEREDLAALSELPVQGRGRAVPLGQVAQVTYGLETPTIWRRSRTPMLLVRGDIADGTQAPVVTAQVLPALDAIKARLPTGYRIETAGAVEESAKGQASINAIMPLMVFTMVALLMLQLQSFSQVFMVVLTAPLGLIGVTSALLLTGAPFGFVATLGFIALAGTIMRNAVILVDQIETDAKSGMPLAEAIVEATVRRSRPIVLTAAAAILALVPLAFSVFWGPMAIAIMGGLVSATALTLLFVPALYAAWHRLPRAAAAQALSRYLPPSGGEGAPEGRVGGQAMASD